MILAQEVPSEGGVRDDGDEERKYYGYDSETSRVVFIKELDEEDDKEENIFIRRKLIRKVSSIAISSNLVDMHVYVFRHWVKEFINDRPEIVSLQSDLIPMLVRAQMNRKTFDRLELSKYIPDNSPNDNISNKKELTVFGYIRRGGIGGRSDTIGRYLNLNRIVCKVSTDARQGNRGDAGYSRMVESVRPIIDNKAMVGSDSLIGKSSKLAEKCVVKRSAIGSHCVIGRNVKITNSVIQDHVTIEDNAKLENTVVCKNAVVKSKSSLKDCEVGAFAIVPANSK
ncbi:putative translation initiation factor eIF-2B subunit gamma [Zancudomyces culisetae]|uniref:Translation initiation factor eIF2B subunit gamma n=1 Tax=Zancudomyces culisetae TaxID=1213189 RepID=A0A1R1PNC1_ZANCU|nr:putative translation initiation factor eIF-2B subunit gamma [Zancudomyces culisetae]|eukprot:OMH82459.1 putative translation initiation factor eIF-2B subunit gamma [Zancudomyces culisetae]